MNFSQFLKKHIYIKAYRLILIVTQSFLRQRNSEVDKKSQENSFSLTLKFSDQYLNSESVRNPSQLEDFFPALEIKLSRYNTITRKFIIKSAKNRQKYLP